MIEERNTFWLVWDPASPRPPMHRHDSYAEAVREAERLAKLSPGQEFYVLGAETMRCVDNMKRVDFVRELPF